MCVFISQKYWRGNVSEQRLFFLKQYCAEISFLNKNNKEENLQWVMRHYQQLTFLKKELCAEMCDLKKTSNTKVCIVECFFCSKAFLRCLKAF